MLLLKEIDYTVDYILNWNKENSTENSLGMRTIYTCNEDYIVAECY